MKHVICPVCGSVCIKYGKNRVGTQRWFCRSCSMAFTQKIDTSAKNLQIFLKWLFSKQIQKDMPGGGRTFRRKTSMFWDIWPLPPKIEGKRDVLYLDGIYVSKKVCVLICCDKDNVLGWYLCRKEHSGAWIALMRRIAEPEIVVSDGGYGFAKALKKVWPNARHQRCLFHVFCQVRRYTTSRPKTPAGAELYMLAKDLMHLETKEDSGKWVERFIEWLKKYNRFLSQMTYDEHGNSSYTHERLRRAQQSLQRLVKNGTMFTYLDESLKSKVDEIPSTNNQIEGGINAQLRAMLREHRGLSIERRLKAIFWWCYMHSPDPLPAAEILKVMPTDKSIADIYERMSKKYKVDNTIPSWGDGIVWEEFHKSVDYPVYWD